MFKILCIAARHTKKHGQATTSIYDVVTYREKKKKLAPRKSKCFYTIDKFFVQNLLIIKYSFLTAIIFNEDFVRIHIFWRFKKLYKKIDAL